MEEETGGEFLDWEVLHSADAPPLAKTLESLSGNSESFEEIGADSDSEEIIWSNYFSLDDQRRDVETGGECDVSEKGSVESDNPSWIEPGLDDRHSGWSGSGRDRSEERKAVVDAKTGLDAAEVFKSQASFLNMTSESDSLYKLDSGEGKYSDDLDRKGELGFPEVVRNRTGIDELDEIRSREKDVGNFWSDSCGDELVSVKFGDIAKEPEIRMDDLVDSGGENGRSAEKEKVSSEEKEEEEEEEAKANGKLVEDEEKKVEWWKVPFEILKYCVFKISPVWSLSVAAAVMGFLILGRRLLKLKKKTQSLQLNVTIDDKKTSQFMSSAARLNEAFLVVRRVPMVRPSLPAAGAGVGVWPAMSLR